MKEDRIDGWEIRPRPDGSFGVYDAHGIVAGPFGSKAEAIAAALLLTRNTGERQPEQPSPKK